MRHKFDKALDKLLYRDARLRKAREIRICRKYLRRARLLGYVDKFWDLTLKSWRDAPDKEVQKRFYEMPSDYQSPESGV